MMNGYMYRGNNVTIPQCADVPRDMKPDGYWARFVQQTISAVDPWEPDEKPIFTMNFGNLNIPPMAVSVQPGMSRIWAIHAGHKARNPQLSPFVIRGEGKEGWGDVTVELVGSVDRPKLVRVYAGDYTPPLPWMVSADWADDGGIVACQEYWLTHAYAFRNTLIREDSITGRVPDWFQNLLNRG